MCTGFGQVLGRWAPFADEGGASRATEGRAWATEDRQDARPRHRVAATSRTAAYPSAAKVASAPCGRRKALKTARNPASATRHGGQAQGRTLHRLLRRTAMGSCAIREWGQNAPHAVARSSTRLLTFRALTTVAESRRVIQSRLPGNSVPRARQKPDMPQLLQVYAARVAPTSAIPGFVRTWCDWSLR